MDYFKFTCPHCQTRIGTSPDTSGHTVTCPSCHGDVIIPPAPATEDQVVPGIAPAKVEVKEEFEAAEHTMMLRKSDIEGQSPQPDPTGAVDQFDGPSVPNMGGLDDDNPFGEPAAESKPANSDTGKIDPFDGPAVPDMGSLADGEANPFGAPAAETKPEEKPAEPQPEEPKAEEKPAESEPAKEEEKPTVAEPPPPPPAPAAEDEDEKKKPAPIELIGNLTTEVKVGLVKQARSHIDDESKWIHGRSGPGGKVVLAAMKSGDTVIPKPPGNSEATHYSIVGSLLVAMDEVNVKSTASGRSELLHQELENAARRVLKKDIEEKVDPMNLSHKDCVAVLDELLKGYRVSLGDDDFADLIAGKKTAPDGTTALDGLMDQEDDSLNLRDVIKTMNDEIKVLKARLDVLEK
jgi:hypothetical protein